MSAALCVLYPGLIQRYALRETKRLRGKISDFVPFPSESPPLAHIEVLS